jgi:hypothetical protein
MPSTYKGVVVSTYHGIEHLECLSCGFKTDDDMTMTIINDMDVPCNCDSSFWLWSINDGTVAVTSGYHHPNGEEYYSRGHYVLVEGGN